MDSQYAPIRWTHWIRFLLIPISLLLLVGALVKQGQGADPAPALGFADIRVIPGTFDVAVATRP